MSTSYYLRDKRITKEHVKQLEELQERFNDKIKELYQNMNLEIENILPTQDDTLLEDCKQYELNYEPEKIWIKDINDCKFALRTMRNVRFIEFKDRDDFINFYKKNKNKYIIIDECYDELTLDEFLEEIKLYD